MAKALDSQSPIRLTRWLVGVVLFLATIAYIFGIATFVRHKLATRAAVFAPRDTLGNQPPLIPTVTGEGGVWIHTLNIGEINFQVEVFNPGEKGPLPAVLLIPGAEPPAGGDAIHQTAIHLADDLHTVALIVRYSQVSPERWLDTLFGTVGFAQRIANVDPQRIALGGEALGATLALRAAADDPRIKAIALKSPQLPPNFTAADAQRLPPALVINGWDGPPPLLGDLLAFSSPDLEFALEAPKRSENGQTEIASEWLDLTAFLVKRLSEMEHFTPSPTRGGNGGV